MGSPKSELVKLTRSSTFKCKIEVKPCPMSSRYEPLLRRERESDLKLSARNPSTSSK